MNHPVLSAIAAMHAALDEIVAVDAIYMSVSEKKAAMVETAKLRARADALELQLLAAGAVDVAEETGARSTAAWLADETRDAHGGVRARATLAKTLDHKWTQTGEALAAGLVNLAQVRVIAGPAGQGRGWPCSSARSLALTTPTRARAFETRCWLGKPTS